MRSHIYFVCLSKSKFDGTFSAEVRYRSDFSDNTIFYKNRLPKTVSNFIIHKDTIHAIHDDSLPSFTIDTYRRTGEVVFA